MTVIRLDAATLAKVQASGRAILADESGTPMGECLVRPITPLDQEPHYTEEEWQAVLSSPVKYTTAEVIERLRGNRG
jgi:hypothetical protein